MLRIVDNPDNELRELAEVALQNMKQKFGKRFCPCGLEQKLSNICPCEDFRNQNYIGECNCGRYIKIDE